MIECSLENITPLFIGSQSSGTLHPPLLKKDRRVIPGSSLKGILRSMAEIVGGGCFVVRDNSSPVPGQFEACRNVNSLCITCRMFGAMERESNARVHNRVHKGKVSIGDADIREDAIETKKIQVSLSNQGTRHEAFYRTPGTGKRDGKSRKLYFHQPKRKENFPQMSGKTWDIDALLPGHHFDFTVQYTSLTEQEYALLLYILTLEENITTRVGPDRLTLCGPMRHKIGNAKPLGLGSCHIQIKRLTVSPPPQQRFKSITADNGKVMQDDTLRQEIHQRIAPFVNDDSLTMQAFRKMMVWDENDTREFGYPSHYWFKDTKNDNSQTPLKEL
jgi:CRISPR/Cas system CSM-associated protein Csm3 (group 7 of RAMP superfamily)